MDKLAFRRHAHIPDSALISVKQPFFMAGQCIWTRIACTFQPIVHDDGRILHPYVHHEGEVAAGIAWCCGLGLFKLLHYNNRGRAHMEIPGPHIHPTHNRRPCSRIPPQLSWRWRNDGIVCNATIERQSPTDVVLLLIRNGGNGHSVSDNGNPRQAFEAMGHLDRRMYRRRITGHRGKPAKPI